MTTKEVAATFLGRAAKAKNPVERSQALREGAAQFAHLASDPRNSKYKGQLTAIGLEFAGAAMKAFEPVAPGLNHDPAVDARAFHALHALYPEGIEHAIEQGEGPSIATPKRVSVLPATFTEETTLGRYAELTFAPTAAQTSAGIKQQDTVALWNGKKTESQAMSIDLGLIFPPILQGDIGGAIPAVDGRLYAKIQYGADGMTQSNLVTVDVGLGRRLTVIGNYIAVLIGMDPPRSNLVGGLPSTSPVLTAGASIAAYAAGSAAPVVRTLYCDAIDPTSSGGEFHAAIPLRAVRLLPPLGASPTDTLFIEFQSINGTPIGAWTTGMPLPFPVPPDAFSIVLTSVQGIPGTGQGPESGIRVPFELSL